jgi:hypothetical protein
MQPPRLHSPSTRQPRARITQPTSGTLTFAQGETTKSFTVPIQEDALVEGTEFLLLTLDRAYRGCGD